MVELTSVNAKLGRAEDHFKIVQDEITAWYDSCAHTHVEERSTDRTLVGLVLRRDGPEPDLLRWTLIIADSIHNLRASLDHLVYAVAKYETRNQLSPDIENLSFVIADNERDFRKWSRTRLKGISAGVLTAIEKVQPYRSVHPVMPHILGILRDFSNADKHRLLRLANAAISSAKVQVASPFKGSKGIYIDPKPIENDDIFCVIKTPNPDPQLKVIAADFGMDIALWHEPREGDTNPMNERSAYHVLLTMMIEEVRTIIREVQSVVEKQHPPFLPPY